MIRQDYSQYFRSRYVGHFDLLGMGPLSIQRPTRAFRAIYDLVLATTEMEGWSAWGRDFNFRLATRLHTLTFFGTTLAFTENATREDAIAMAVFSAELVTEGIRSGLPVRGGVAFGRLGVAEAGTGVAGPALVRAYRLGEATQWIGVVVEARVASRWRQHRPRDLSQRLLVHWEVLQKDGSRVPLRAVNWPRFLPEGVLERPPIAAEDFYKLFYLYFGRFSRLPAAVRHKYEEAATFYNSNSR